MEEMIDYITSFMRTEYNGRFDVEIKSNDEPWAVLIKIYETDFNTVLELSKLIIKTGWGLDCLKSINRIFPNPPYPSEMNYEIEINFYWLKR